MKAEVEEGEEEEEGVNVAFGAGSMDQWMGAVGRQDGTERNGTARVAVAVVVMVDLQWWASR